MIDSHSGLVEPIGIRRPDLHNAAHVGFRPQQLLPIRLREGLPRIRNDIFLIAAYVKRTIQGVVVTDVVVHLEQAVVGTTVRGEILGLVDYAAGGAGVRSDKNASFRRDFA